MIDLRHHSTYESVNEIHTINFSEYSTVVYSDFMDVDERTRWLKDFYQKMSCEKTKVSFDSVMMQLIINDNHVACMDLNNHLPKPSSKILLDSTSLTFPVIQYLLLWLKENNYPFDVLYIEPEEYTQDSNELQCISNENFVLSEDGPGLVQLPPFIGSIQLKTTHVVSIGFEGRRVVGLFNNDQISEQGLTDLRVVIAIPAFKAGFDRVSLKNNALALQEISRVARREIMYSSASNPFTMLEILEGILKSLPSDEFEPANMNLIPFGTKPAALGMAWFAVKHDEEVIVTYDNTKNAGGRSNGIGKMHLTQFC